MGQIHRMDQHFKVGSIGVEAVQVLEGGRKDQVQLVEGQVQFGLLVAGLFSLDVLVPHETEIGGGRRQDGNEDEPCFVHFTFSDLASVFSSAIPGRLCPSGV